MRNAIYRWTAGIGCCLFALAMLGCGSPDSGSAVKPTDAPAAGKQVDGEHDTHEHADGAPTGRRPSTGRTPTSMRVTSMTTTKGTLTSKPGPAVCRRISPRPWRNSGRCTRPSGMRSRPATRTRPTNRCTRSATCSNPCRNWRARPDWAVKSWPPPSRLRRPCSRRTERSTKRSTPARSRTTSRSLRQLDKAMAELSELAKQPAKAK